MVMFWLSLPSAVQNKVYHNYNSINQYILNFQLELETTMRQECEAKLTLTSTNYESKIATLEKELEEVSWMIK